MGYVVGTVSAMMLFFLIFCMCMKQDDEEEIAQPKVVNASEDTEMTT